MIVFDESLVCLWYVCFGGSDFLAGLSKTQTGGEILYRYMRYNSPAPFDPKDESEWYRIQGTNIDDMIAKMRIVYERLKSQHPRGPFAELMKGDQTIEEFFKVLDAQPFFHKQIHPIH